MVEIVGSTTAFVYTHVMLFGDVLEYESSLIFVFCMTMK